MEQKNKLFNTVVVIIIVLIFINFFGSCMSSCNSKTQYEKDFESMQNKRIDEMTPGEEKAFRDYLKWELEQHNK